MAVGSPPPPPPSAPDFSAKLAARWAPGALYFFIEVTDDQHRNAAASADLIWQDCPQLAFDTANNKGTTYDSTDD